jgi:hypothetical protein
MKNYLILLSLILLFSCQNKEIVAKPDNLIDRATMINILYDLNLMQAYTNHNFESSTNKNIPTFLREKYKVDSLQFVQSNKYYASQIANYQKMYDEVYQRVKADITAAETLK